MNFEELVAGLEVLKIRLKDEGFQEVADLDDYVLSRLCDPNISEETKQVLNDIMGILRSTKMLRLMGIQPITNAEWESLEHFPSGPEPDPNIEGPENITVSDWG